MRENARFWKQHYESVSLLVKQEREQHAKSRSEALALLQRIYEMHSPYIDPGEIGSAHSVKVWCNDCRHPWPCATATALLNYDEIDPPKGYEPMGLLPRGLNAQPTEPSL